MLGYFCFRNIASALVTFLFGCCDMFHQFQHVPPRVASESCACTLELSHHSRSMYDQLAKHAAVGTRKSTTAGRGVTPPPRMVAAVLATGVPALRRGAAAEGMTTGTTIPGTQQRRSRSCGDGTHRTRSSRRVNFTECPSTSLVIHSEADATASKGVRRNSRRWLNAGYNSFVQSQTLADRLWRICQCT